METLKLDRDGDVAWLRLNRPDKLNAMSTQLWDELRELGEKMVDDATLRCLVVISEGRAFSAGIDTSTFTGGGGLEPGASEHEDPVVGAVLRTQRAFTWLEDAPYPTVAAVRGYALGAGLQLAMACDLRIMARGTKLGVFEQKYGIMPDLGGTHWLPRLVGTAKAKELTWTVAEFDADEAYRIGLCERLVESDELETVAAELAATIAAQPPLAVRGAKRAINLALGSDRDTVLRVTAEDQAACLRSNDFSEAIGAFVEGRAPNYTGT